MHSDVLDSENPRSAILHLTVVPMTHQFMFINPDENNIPQAQALSTTWVSPW